MSQSSAWWPSSPCERRRWRWRSEELQRLCRTVLGREGEMLLRLGGTLPPASSTPSPPCKMGSLWPQTCSRLHAHPLLLLLLQWLQTEALAWGSFLPWGSSWVLGLCLFYCEYLKTTFFILLIMCAAAANSTAGGNDWLVKCLPRAWIRLWLKTCNLKQPSMYASVWYYCHLIHKSWLFKTR